MSKRAQSGRIAGETAGLYAICPLCVGGRDILLSLRFLSYPFCARLRHVPRTGREPVGRGCFSVQCPNSASWLVRRMQRLKWRARDAPQTDGARQERARARPDPESAGQVTPSVR
jgi:hypothetical protein